MIRTATVEEILGPGDDGISRIEATYVVGREDWPEFPDRYVKIGHTHIRIPPRSEGFNGSHNHVSKLFQRRLDALQVGSPDKLRLLCEFVAYRHPERHFPAGHLERWLHERFAARRVQGEWFNFPAPCKNVVREVQGVLSEYEIATGRAIGIAGGYPGPPSGVTAEACTVRACPCPPNWPGNPVHTHYRVRI